MFHWMYVPGKRVLHNSSTATSTTTSRAGGDKRRQERTGEDRRGQERTGEKRLVGKTQEQKQRGRSARGAVDATAHFVG
jgi:hypothetical protein